VLDGAGAGDGRGRVGEGQIGPAGGQSQANTETRVATIDTTATSGDTTSASLALQAAGLSGTAGVSCQSSLPGTGTAPAVSVTSAINAIQTAANS
jgi:hypothetical protein